jgi:nucleoside-diphosphate-sugar epimerase
VRILITGINGFLGAWLGKRFSEDGNEVVGIYREDPGPRLAHCPKARALRCDITDREGIARTLRETRPERILHLAAYGTYPRSQQDSRRMIETNVLGTNHLLEAAAASGLPGLKIIHAGSSSEYGLKEGTMAESDVLEPHDVYGATKAASTILARALGQSFGLPVVALRLFSVYGPLEEEGRLIVSLLKAALHGEALELTSGEQVRDFIHVEDVYRAFDLACHASVSSGVFNIGTGVETSVREAAELVRELFPAWKGPRFGGRPLEDEKAAVSWKADTSRAERDLGFKAGTDLRSGVAQTASWLRDYL